MPRKARIDAPGALHHIIVRGNLGTSLTELTNLPGENPEDNRCKSFEFHLQTENKTSFIPPV